MSESKLRIFYRITYPDGNMEYIENDFVYLVLPKLFKDKYEHWVSKQPWYIRWFFDRNNRKNWPTIHRLSDGGSWELVFYWPITKLHNC